MLKRIMNFNKQDWKHIGWLLKTMINNFVKGDINEFVEGYYLIKLHLSYNSRKIK